MRAPKVVYFYTAAWPDFTPALTRSVTDGPIVLTVTGVRHPDEAEQHARSRLAHDMNNIIGGMLANLHLCLADLPNDHPIRRRLETVNQSALDLRSSVRKLAAP